MSRQPPPPGVPRSDTYRPGGYSSNQGNYQSNNYRDERDRYDSFDRYDAPRDRDHDRERNHGPQMYQFGGNNRTRSPPRGPQGLRSPPRGSRRSRSPLRRFSPPRYNSKNNDYGGDHRDDWHPGPAQNNRSQYDSGPMNFSFRHDAPHSISSQPRNDSYVPRNYNGPQRGSGSRGGFRGGRGGPRWASDRAFLKGNREPTPELMTGMVESEKQGAKYIPIEDVSDSSEAEMDMSDDDEDEDAEPKKKQVKIVKKAADGDSVPKWSNPDPYTALPPVEESRKRKDVVKLIRKARVEAATAKAEITPVDDFISFGDDKDDARDEAPIVPALKARTMPKAPLPKPNQVIDLLSDDEVIAKTASNKRALEPSNNPDLGSRKRTIRDEIKDTPTLRQALAGKAPRPDFNIHKSTKGKRPAANGSITKEWLGSDTPWINIDHSDTAKMGVWLHKEIIDFYDYVKPRRFEEFIRAKLVEDLRSRVQNAYRREQADILTFGSYPAGLYLPTADMDIVCVSREYMNGGHAVLGSKSTCHRFALFLKSENLPVKDTVEVITGAKVPLVKYVDRLTGLKVDISFENDTGLIANKTFQEWKIKQPAMPLIVTLIKHFLAMRGLNEPMNGGIGGFSVICLVQSLLEMLPYVGRDEVSQHMIPEHHLGEVLMEFFDLYGNRFNFITTGIQLKPHAYVSKADLGNLPYKKTQNKPTAKICIIDPNRSSNDISGGSSNTSTILRALAEAYRLLQNRMTHLRTAEDRQNESILSCILGGNYRSFELQRQHLRSVCQELYPEHEIED